MLYKNVEKNMILFDEKDFHINHNYLPLIVDALKDLDNSKDIHFGILLEETPAIFVMYISKVIKDSGIKIHMYFKEDSDSLRQGLESEKIPWHSFAEFELLLK